MKLKSKEVVSHPSQEGNIAFENAYYTRPSGFDKIRSQVQMIRSDIADPEAFSFSTDNGRTWSQPHVRPIEQPENGTLRVWDSPGFIDPINGLLLNIVMEGVLANDAPIDGMTSYYLKYRVSNDGGHTILHEEPIIQRGGKHSTENPFEGVWAGRNALMSSVDGSLQRTPHGHLILATMITPLGPDGTYFNPCNATSYSEVAIIFGCWQADGRIEWELGPRLANPPERSTRGAIEPTMALLNDGRIFMVLRGSNETNLELPGHKWFTVSADGGRSWSDIQPWRYSNGEAFFSPSSCSQLLRHSSGKLFWFGNICPENPQGNEPRHPLVAGEVDETSLTLKEDTLFEVQGFDPDGPGYQQYSNFSVHEDRENGDLLMYLTSLFIDDAGAESGDAYLYRLEL